jgi:thiol-disulfide isomerase/thioredoxin
MPGTSLTVRATIAWASLAALAILATACGYFDAVEYGIYRGVLTLPGGEAPFGLEIREESGAPVAYLINGPERVRVSDVKVKGRRIEMTMPGFGNRLQATRTPTGLKGHVVLVKRDGVEQMIPLTAERGATHRFFKDHASDNADVSGRWAATFIEASGKRAPAVGEFKQSFHELNGTFLRPAGDQRYLAGEMRADELYLSAFDGSHVYLLRAKVTSRGELQGKFWSGLAWVEDWTARRDPNAALADPNKVTTISDDTWHFGFTFPDETGKPVSLADEKFRNKVVIVTLAGSWCPNCHDATAFMAPFYEQNRERGLEVVGLMFEHFEDFERAARAVTEFRRKFSIRYTTLIAGISDKEDAATRLPQLNGVFAFPTTLFIDRRGRVRRIHTGFSGPATGEHYEELVRSFTETAQTLLAERP